jgi:quinol monooxygenase YgiN
MEAKPGKAEEAAPFLRSALPLAQQEPATTVWFAWCIGTNTFGIFDAFGDESGRQAHETGPIAAALMARAPDLFVGTPSIEKLDVLAAKLKVTPAHARAATSGINLSFEPASCSLNSQASPTAFFYGNRS